MHTVRSRICNEYMDALCFFSCTRSTINDSLHLQLHMHSRAKRAKANLVLGYARDVSRNRSQIFFYISQYFGTHNIEVIRLNFAIMKFLLSYLMHIVFTSVRHYAARDQKHFYLILNSHTSEYSSAINNHFNERDKNK